MTQLLCLKLYRLRRFIQVNVLLFLLLYFLKRTSGVPKKNLSNQLSNSSTNFGLGIKQPSSRQNPKLLIKTSSVY